MTKSTFFKFLFISLSNMKKLIVVNLILLVPLAVFCYTLVQLIPLVVRYIDSMNISVLYVHPDYNKLAVVVIGNRSNSAEQMDHQVYVFERKVLSPIRKYIFLSELKENSRQVLRQKSLAYGEVQYPKQTITLQGKDGQTVITFKVEDVREGSIEILFYNSLFPLPDRMVFLYTSLLIVSFFIISGSLGGISDYTQRVVFHETKGFSYLFKSIRKSFGRSVLICLFFSIIIGAVVANIYFYIFIMSADISVFIAAINFWMLVFFLFILLWVFPIFAMSGDESIWKVMKKSLFISFDNFDFTLITLLVLFLMGIISVLTLFIVPGFAGTFSFLNTSLKELSSRYSSPETVV